MVRPTIECSPLKVMLKMPTCASVPSQTLFPEHQIVGSKLIACVPPSLLSSRQPLHSTACTANPLEASKIRALYLKCTPGTCTQCAPQKPTPRVRGEPLSPSLSLPLYIPLHFLLSLTFSPYAGLSTQLLTTVADVIGRPWNFRLLRQSIASQKKLANQKTAGTFSLSGACSPMWFYRRGSTLQMPPHAKMPR